MTGLSKRPHQEHGPVALIVGCGDIGMAAARSLAGRCRLVIADISEQRLERAVTTLNLEGFNAEGVVCDITSSDSVSLLAQKVSTTGVQTLVHVAAIGGVTEWQKIMDVDLLGVHRISGEIGPHITTGGSAIFISSLASYTVQATPNLMGVLEKPLSEDFFQQLPRAYGKTPEWHDAYALSKLGMRRHVEHLAVSWGSNQVRAVSISLGMFDTTMARKDGGTLARPGGDGEMISRAELAEITLPMRREGTIPEVAGVIAFLASHDASYISGVDIVVDGGALASNRLRGTME